MHFCHLGEGRALYFSDEAHWLIYARHIPQGIGTLLGKKGVVRNTLVINLMVVWIYYLVYDAVVLAQWIYTKT